MKIKTFILTFLLVMSCPFLFGQSRAVVTTEVSNLEGLIEALTVINEGSDETEISITLMKDITIPAAQAPIEIVEGKVVTLNLNGYIIKTSSDKYVFNNLGKLTIEDGASERSAIEGRGIYNGRIQGEGQNINENAVLTIKNGTFKSTSSQGGAAIFNFGIANIESGSFHGKYAAIVNQGNMTINNAEIMSDNLAINNDSTLTIGNTYYYGKIDRGYTEALEKPAVYTEEPAGSVKPFEAYLSAQDAYFNDRSGYFKTLAEAVTAVPADAKKAEIRLLANANANEIIQINQPVTIDLNKKTVTSTAKNAFEVYADATFKNGTIDGAGRCINTRAAVELNLEGVTLSAEEYTSAYANPQPLTIGGSDNGTNVNLENVTIKAGTTGYGIISFVKTELTADADTEISGYAALYVKDGSEGSVFTFNGSTLNGTIGNNDVEGNSFSTIAIQEDNVTVNVIDGTIKSNGKNHAALSVGLKDNPNSGNKVKLDATIEGNVLFMSSANGNEVLIRKEYADASWSTTAADNGLVQVHGVAVAKIGDVTYTSMMEALAAAETQNGAFIDLIADATGDESSQTFTFTNDVKSSFFIRGTSNYKLPKIVVTAGDRMDFRLGNFTNVNCEVEKGASLKIFNAKVSGSFVNNGNIEVNGSSDINAEAYSGTGDVKMTNVELTSATNLNGAKVYVQGTKGDIKGSVIKGALFHIADNVALTAENATITTKVASVNDMLVGAGSKFTAKNSYVQASYLEVKGELNIEGSNMAQDGYTLYVNNNVVASNGTVINIEDANVRAKSIVGEGFTLAMDKESFFETAKVTGEFKDASTEGKIVYDEVNKGYHVVSQIQEGVDAVAIGAIGYTTLAEALEVANAMEDENIIITLQSKYTGNEGVIDMKGAIFGGKTITITGDNPESEYKADWSKGWLFVGRGGEGDGKLIFNNVKLASNSNNNTYGINVSGRNKETIDTYNGVVEIKNSTIELDYLINKGTMTLDNSTLTVKNGFSVGGRPASETENGEDATATMTLNNNSKVVVNNHNGMGLGYEALGVMNIDETSTFETTQNFLVTAKGTMNVNGGTVMIAEGMTLTNNGTVYVTGEANLAAAKVTGDGWFYMNGVSLDADTKLLGAKVRFASGTNNIDGSTIDDGFFQVGIGAFYGTDANVDTENSVIVNVKNAHIGSNGSTYAGWAGTGFYDTDELKATVMTDAKYVLNIENSIAEFGYLHISNDGELNVKGKAAEPVSYNNSEYSFYAGDFIINGTATFYATDVLALYTKVSCDNGTDNPGKLNINAETEYEAERHNGAIAGTNFILYKTGVANVAKGANLHVGELASIATDAKFNIGGTATVLGDITNNGTIALTDLAAKFTAKKDLTVINGTENGDIKVVYKDGAYQFIEKVYVAQIGENKYESVAEALQAVKDGQTIEIIGKEGDKEPDAINYDGEGKEFTITSAEGSMYSFGGNKITLANATVNLDNANINGIVVASTDATVNIKGTTYVKTLMSAGTGIYSVNGATFNVGTLMSDVYVSGKSTLTVDAYTSGTLYAKEVTLDENTTLPTGVKVVFENENTVNNTSLKGNIVFNNGTTTFDGASLTGSVNVKDGATVNFTKNTYLNTTGNGQSVIVAGTLKINASGAWATTVNVAGTGELNIEGRNEIDNTYLDNNDLNVRGTLTNNGKITIGSESMVTIASAVSGSELVGNGTLTIAGTAKVDALNVAKENIANTIELNGAAAKFYAPAGLTNVFDAVGIQEPTYIEEEEDGDGYYSLDGTYVAEIVNEDEGKTYQFRTIKSALASEHFNGEITLINNTNEKAFNIKEDVIFKTNPDSLIEIAHRAVVSAGKTLTIAENANIKFAHLVNTGAVINNGNLNVYVLLDNQGSFTNNATITAETLVNAADVTFTNNGTLTAATVTNNGKIENAAESSLTVNGTLTNDGTITNNGTLSATTFTNGNIFNNKSGNATFGSVANNGTINNYATLNVTEFTANVNDGVQLYAGSIKVDESLSEIGGNFVVYSTTLDNETKLQGANIIFANGEESSINGATLTNSTLNVKINHTLTINSDLDIASLELAYNKLTYYPYTESFSEVNVSGTLTAATVTNNAILNVTGSLTTTLTNNSTGTITNDGTITANTNGIENNGSLTNEGTITAATVTNSGTINNAAGSYKFTVNGTLTNNGTLYNGKKENNTIIAGTLEVSTLQNNGNLYNYGTATVTNSLTNNKDVYVYSGATLTVKNGIYNGCDDFGNANNVNAYINIAGTFEAESSSWWGAYFTNSAKIDLTGTLNVNDSYYFTNNGTVNVEGTSAVINIANNVSGTCTFNMTNVKLDGENMLKNANIVFVEGTYYSQKSSEISGATLTDSNLTVDSGYELEVTADLNLDNGNLTNNGTVTFGKDGSDITLSGATLTNSGTLTIQHNDIASFGKVTNSNVIKVLTATLNATSFDNQTGAKVNVEGSSVLTATVTGTGTFEMNNVSLDGDTKLTGANINFSNKGNQVTSSDLSGSTVTVNSGAELTLDGEVKAGAVTTPVAGTIRMYDDDVKFYTSTEGLTITPDCTGDVVVYNVEGGYYYINSTRVAIANGVEYYSSLQAAIVAAGENGTVTIIAGEITESVTVSNNTTFELSTDITAATINGELTVNDTAEFKGEYTFNAVKMGEKAKVVANKLTTDKLSMPGNNSILTLTGEESVLTLNGTSSLIYGSARVVLAERNATFKTVYDVLLENVVPSEELDVDYKVSYKNGQYQLVSQYVAQSVTADGTVIERHETLAEALKEVASNGTIELLWEEGDDPIVMEGVLSGKNVTIKAAVNNDPGMVVDWSEGRLYIGRMAAFNNGPATLTFDGVKFTSVNDTDADYGIFVSGRVKNSEHYNGTLVIKDSEVVISSIYNQNNTEIENSTVTFKTAKGVVVSGINAGDSPTGDMTTSTLDINNSIVNVENITVGERGVGRVLVDVDLVENEFTPDNNGKSQISVSTLNVLANGMLRSAGDIDGTIINAGDVELTGGIYTPNRPYDEWCHANYAVYQLTENSWEVRQAKGEQEINLTANWNWFSTYINNGEATNFSNLKKALVNDADMIKGQRGFVSNYGTAWLPGTLTTISTGEMYMIKMRDAKTIKLEGPFENYSTRTIELNEGWNWIGYPVAYELPVEVALMNFVPNEGDQIKGLETNELASYYGGQWWYTEGKFNLVPGHGYMYKSAAKNAFFYNAIDITNTNTGNRNSIDYHWNSDASQYPTNMSIIAMVTMDGEVVNSNYEVAAFANGELRGSARPVYVDVLDAYILMMNISGDEVEELTFKYYDVNYGTEYVLSNRINYSTDAVLGSMDEPYMLTLDILNIDEAAANEISIYPNPTTTNVEINLNATCDTVEVFNALGVKVAEYSNVDSIDALETAGVYVIRITNDGNVQNCRLVVK